MPQTPDRSPGPRSEEKLTLTNDGYTADAPGDMVFDGADFSFRDTTGVFNPRTGGTPDSGWRRHFLLMGG